MKKKFTLIISFCVLTLLISGGLYYFNIYNSIEEINIDGNYVTYDSEEALNEAADIILYGTPVDEFEKREHVNVYNNDDTLSDFYTLTKFDIKKVLKNISSLKINETDLFNIIEPVSLIQNLDGKKILEIDSYQAMEETNNYIVYLKSNNNGGYSVINMSNGKFDMDNDNNDNRINESQETTKHLEIKNDVIKRFSKEIYK